MHWFRQALVKHRIVFLAILLVESFYSVDGLSFVHAKELSRQQTRRELAAIARMLDIPAESWLSEPESRLESVSREVWHGVGQVLGTASTRVEETAMAAGDSLWHWAKVANAMPVAKPTAHHVPMPLVAKTRLATLATLTSLPALGAASGVALASAVAGPPRPPSRHRGGMGLPLALGLEPPLKSVDQLAVASGWNLLSLPKKPADPTPAVVLSSIGGQYDEVWTYDACDVADPWKLYDPSDPAGSDLTRLDHQPGFWIRGTASATLPVDGNVPASTTYQLCVGWNLIGYPSAEPRHPGAVLSPIAGKWARLFSFDPFTPDDPWQGYDPQAPNWANNLPLMLPGRGYWLLVTEATTLEITNQGAPPTVAISSPADLAVVTEPTEVLGTVDSDRLDNWTLTYRAIGDGDPVMLATGTAPVSGGILGSFDPTLLLNGLYELELTAIDIQGQQVSASIAVAVEGQMKLGHFTLSFVDLAIPVSGLSIEVIRTYDSRDKRLGDFGIGWSLDIRQGSYRNNRAPGDGWRLEKGFFPCDTVIESKSHLTVVRLSDQEVYRFALRLQDGAPSSGGGCFANARFDFVDGPLPGTTLEIVGNDQVFYGSDSGRVIDVESLEVYEPENVRLTTRDGRVFEINLTGGVTQLEDLNGTQLSITDDGVTHSSGNGIVFDRDVEGRIIGTTDPLGRESSYVYDSRGDLSSFIDRAGASTHFFYADHRLLEVDDARGIKSIRNEYDAEGRLLRHIDAFGKVVEFSHDLEGRRKVVNNRLGASRVLEYDSNGNIIREVDELGNETRRTYDPNDNLLSETDPLGRTATYTYTAGNDLATKSDPLGHVTSYTYNSRSQFLTATDPRGGVTANTFDSRGCLTRTTNPLGKVTSSSYDTAGNLLTTIDSMGQATSFEYDSFGNRKREVNALGHVTETTYNAMGRRLTETRSRTLADGSTEDLVTSFIYDELDRVTKVVSADGSSFSTQYDLLGNVIGRIDPLGRATVLTYDLVGRLVSISYPDGTTEGRSYDDEGRLIAEIDRAGRTTRSEYDPAGRLLTTVYPDGSSTSNGYDVSGQLVAVTDARSHTTSYAYDAGGRVTEVVDPLGNRLTFTYDEVGNRTAIVDAEGQTTSFVFDALNRLITTVFSDGTTGQVTYDELGRRGAEVDQAGIKTEFGYDAVGRLTSVEDALGQVAVYIYDEVGNRIAQTDANGHSTRFEYDRRGRRTARVFPDGARETMAYNADGTLASHTGFGGATRTFQYDEDRRLTRRAHPDGSEVNIAYTPTGQRATVTGARGTTTYTYDEGNRLTSKTDPDGHGLSYSYDSQGNRTRLTATVGTEVFTTAYTYDSLNRLTTVTDSQGGLSTLGYDSRGNPTHLALPNGSTTQYTYDVLNRLTSLSTEASTGSAISSYAFTLGPAGERLGIVEHDGTSRSYRYDALYRLTQERVTDSAGTPTYIREFVYDAVGNRVQQVLQNASGSAEVLLDYDSRNRLLTANAVTYLWDISGNLASSGGRDYSWNREDRLASVALADGTLVESMYDIDGNRVRSAVTSPGEAEVVVSYLVDTSSSLSHVVAEIVDGKAKTLYSRAGDQLLGLFRPVLGASRYFHLDGLGSVRTLSDESAEVTDRYVYAAFGELLDHSGGDIQPFLFAGENFDANVGFYYNRARWLDVARGRFVGVDPFGGDHREPSSLHRYLYASGDPVNKVDPSGRRSVFAFSVAAVVVGMIAANIPGVLGLGRGTPFGDRVVPFRVRPVVIDSKWQDWEVHQIQEQAAKTLYDRARVRLEFDPIERVEGENLLIHRKSVEELILRFYSQKGIVPALYARELLGAAGIGGGDHWNVTWRGLLVDRSALDKRHVLAHELGHTAGFLLHQPCFGASLFLMGGGPFCATRGSLLTRFERWQLRVFAGRPTNYSP